jgi:homoserine dehydrogenase
VLPQFIKSTNQLFNVDNEFNGVITEGRFSGEQFQQGRGAGSYPTGAAVLSDVSALSYGYKYEFKKHLQKHPSGFTNDVILNVYFRYSKPKDVELLNFIDVSETYKSNDYNYIIGKLNLGSLIKHKNYLKENKLFVALVNDEIQLLS